MPLRFLSVIGLCLALSACQHTYTAESWEAEIVSNFKASAKARQRTGRCGFVRNLAQRACYDSPAAESGGSMRLT